MLAACPDCHKWAIPEREPLPRWSDGRVCYEATRKPRTSRIQAISSANTWMQCGDQNTSWLYGYDAWNVPLAEAKAGPDSAIAP